QGGRDRAGRMDDGLEMGVVIVEDMRGNAVDERGMKLVQTFLAPDDRCALRAREGNRDGKGAIHRFVLAAADRAAQPVDEGAQALGPYRCRNVRRLQPDRPCGQFLRYCNVSHVSLVTGPGKPVRVTGDW